METPVFSTIVQPYILHNNPIFDFKSLHLGWDHNCLITLSLEEEALAAITEFINSNQPMSFPTHTFMCE